MNRQHKAVQWLLIALDIKYITYITCLIAFDKSTTAVKHDTLKYTII